MITLFSIQHTRKEENRKSRLCAQCIHIKKIGANQFQRMFFVQNVIHTFRDFFNIRFQSFCKTCMFFNSEWEIFNFFLFLKVRKEFGKYFKKWLSDEYHGEFILFTIIFCLQIFVWKIIFLNNLFWIKMNKMLQFEKSGTMKNIWNIFFYLKEFYKFYFFKQLLY